PDIVDELLGLPAPAPDWKSQARARNASLPIEQRDWFEDQPPDKAPLDILLGYWEDYWSRGSENPPEMSSATQVRLLEAFEEDPCAHLELLGWLRKSPVAHSHIRAILDSPFASKMPFECRETIRS